MTRHGKPGSSGVQDMKSIGANWQRAFQVLGFLALAVLLLQMPAYPSRAAETPSATTSDEKIREFNTLLKDPVIRDFIARGKAAGDLSAGGAAPATATPPAEAGEENDLGLVSRALEDTRGHLMRITAAWPRIPIHFSVLGSTVMTEIADRGFLIILALIGLFTGTGLAVSYVMFRLARPIRLWTISLDRTSALGRLGKFIGRFALGILMVSGFFVGSAGTFMMFEWPRLLREIVLAFLTAALIVWAVRAVAISLLLPSLAKVTHAREVRAFDIDDSQADHWFRWIMIFTIVFTFAGASISLLPRFGFSEMEILAIQIPVDLVMVTIASLAVWRRPASRPLSTAMENARRAGFSWLVTAFLLLLFVIRTAGAYGAFWFVFACFALPAAIFMAARSVRYVLREPLPGEEGKGVAPITVAVIDRAIRLVLIAAAGYFLAEVLGLDADSMRDVSPTTTWLFEGMLNAAVIVLAADFLWSIVRATIQRRLGGERAPVMEEEGGGPMLDPQQARMRTLLPIVQNILFAVLLVLTALMVLSSMGVQIGPLVAGAGVVGVAVGFGAQTLVKDIISGIFYLFDDAFRVGEYISSGKYDGTVESFSLRSIKLRHHRGALFTIPFGELGAVRNQSRDWTVDKFNITVGFDTDLEKARKLIKKLGIELSEDPEFRPWVIEPIKMQGVQEFGDYGIVLRMKVTMKPGGAFAMKRKFLARIKQIFKENGIELPVPTVHVQSNGPHEAGSEAELAAARTLVENRKLPLPTEAESPG